MNEPNFERDRWEGQMNPSERQLLYQVVMQTKPDTVVEVGTCRGGGSTYFIACALRNLELGGKLFTCENNREFYEYARNLYATNPDFSGLEQHVDFTFGTAADMAMKLGGYIDLCLLDGGADRHSILYEFAMFRQLIPVGKFLLIHDWEEKDYEKCKLIRPILLEDTDWQLVDRNMELVVFQRVADTHAENS